MGIALDMLLSTHADLQLLGLESLQQITASNDSPFVAGAILKGEYFEKIMTLVTADGADLSEIEKRNFNVLRRMAITVLSRCLQNLSPDEVSSTVQETDLEKFLVALAGFLDRSATCPHEALFAMRCLQSISGVHGVRDDLVLSNSINNVCSFTEYP